MDSTERGPYGCRGLEDQLGESGRSPDLWTLQNKSNQYYFPGSTLVIPDN